MQSGVLLGQEYVPASSKPRAPPTNTVPYTRITYSLIVEERVDHFLEVLMFLLKLVLRKLIFRQYTVCHTELAS